VSAVKIAVISSVGGHLTEVLALRAAYEAYPHFYVFNDVTQFTPPSGIRVYTIAHAERDVRVLWNIWEFTRIFLRERPTVMLSTGAGLAVPAALVARILGIRVVYVETVASVRQPSLTGLLMPAWSDTVFVQWPQLLSRVENSQCMGSIFGSS
jgi:UDP-N-acetylglucosamine:LPS N-acetylglucosamine transferase